MTPHKNELTEARRRIDAAFDPKLLEAAGHRLADMLGTHLGKIEKGQGAVLNWREPQANID